MKSALRDSELPRVAPKSTDGGSDTHTRSARIAIGTLQVVLKVVERCNINCSYCYYFNGGDETALKRPIYISEETIDLVANYLADGIRDLKISRLLISFHGGEPLMLKPRVLDEACKKVREAVGDAANVAFLVQTNGTIWNSDFADVFTKHNILLGVSLDGGKAANDRYRLDHQGRSTFNRIAKKIESMRETLSESQARDFGCISVLDPANDYRTAYTELRQLGFKNLSFLLADRSYETPADEEYMDECGRALEEIAEAYFDEDDTAVRVRQVESILDVFQKRHTPAGLDSSAPGESRRHLPFQIMVIHSDGEVSLNDSFMPALSWWKTTPKLHVGSSSVRDFVDMSVQDRIDEELGYIPTACGDCRWRGFCRGGDLENRFSASTGFNNPSVYCGALKRFYSRVERLLEENGYPAEEIESAVVRSRQESSAGAEVSVER